MPNKINSFTSSHWFALQETLPNFFKHSRTSWSIDHSPKANSNIIVVGYLPDIASSSQEFHWNVSETIFESKFFLETIFDPDNPRVDRMVESENLFMHRLEEFTRGTSSRTSRERECESPAYARRNRVNTPRSLFALLTRFSGCFHDPSVRGTSSDVHTASPVCRDSSSFRFSVFFGNLQWYT